MRLRTIVLALLLLVVPFVAAGCDSASDKIAEKVVEEQTGGDVDIDTKDGEVSVSGKDGAASFSSKDELPKGWPSDIDLPKDAKIKGSSSVKADGGTNYTVTAEDEDSLDDIVDHFQDELDGWKSTSSTDSEADGRASSFQTWEKDKQMFTLVVSDAGDIRTFVATITPDTTG